MKTMRGSRGLCAGLVLLAVGSVGCSPRPAAAPRTDAVPEERNEPALAGKVVETMPGGRYTYLLVASGAATEWVAVPQCEVKVGEEVTIPDGMQMSNFESPTLKRKFERIRFASGILRKGGPAGAAGGSAYPPASAAGAAETVCPVSHSGAAAGSAGAGAVCPVNPSGSQAAPHPPAVTAAPQDYKGLTKPAGGKTVAEVYAEKTALAGKSVTLRGKVVKFNAKIMDKNWLHLRDGSGAEGGNDLTVVTLDQAGVGQTVVVTGRLALNKDFGYGYQYPVILEEARVTVEK